MGDRWERNLEYDSAGRGGLRRETRGYEKGLDRQNLRRIM